MAVEPAAKQMTSEEIVALNRAHTFFSWSIQGALDPIAIDHAEGVYLYTPEGRRILDFNSQLMSVNIGHGDRRVIDAITEQAPKLQYVQPAFATEIRARLGAKLAEILPGDLDKVFFTLGGAEAIENAIKLARHHTGRHKVLARYRAYHGATFGAMTLTGDPRRWANEPGLVGVVRYPDTHRWGEKEPRPVDGEPAGPRGRHPLRGRPHDRRGLPRDDRRHERDPHPARRLHPGRPRDLRPERHPDGLRRGHGRLRADRALVRGRPLGRHARPDDDGQGPDELVPAARGRGDAPRDRRGVRDEDVLRRPDLLVATRSASPRRWRRSGSTRRTTSSATPGGSGRSCARHHERLAAKHPSVGRDAQPRPVRDHRPRPEPRSVDAAHAVQRHVRRDEGDRQVLPRRTASSRSRRTTRSTRTRRCASPRSSSPRASTIIDRALDIADQAVTG